MLQYFYAGTEGAPRCCWDQMKPFLTCIVSGVLVTLCDHTHLRCTRHESPRRSCQPLFIYFFVLCFIFCMRSHCKCLSLNESQKSDLYRLSGINAFIKNPPQQRCYLSLETTLPALVLLMWSVKLSS